MLVLMVLHYRRVKSPVALQITGGGRLNGAAYDTSARVLQRRPIGGGGGCRGGQFYCTTDYGFGTTLPTLELLYVRTYLPTYLL
jgi:hypothetical protein